MLLYIIMVYVKPALRLAGRTAIMNTIGTPRETGGITSARYCYSVWLRHLTLLNRNGVPGIPERVVEFGPGDTLGVGVCALLSGVKEYCALDAVRRVDAEKNRRPMEEQFEEIVELFENRARIPDNTEFPRIHPELESYDFPGDILTEGIAETSLDESRLKRIRRELLGVGGGDTSTIRYVAPWDETVGIRPGSIDLILSQAVMEYVGDLAMAYGLMYGWLKTGGAISHEIDFKSHGTALRWNGHWGYSSRLWRLVNGRAACWINRFPHSCHLREIRRSGFRVIRDDLAHEKSDFPKDRLDASLIDLFEETDFTISSSHIQAIKPGVLSNIFFKTSWKLQRDEGWPQMISVGETGRGLEPRRRD